MNDKENASRGGATLAVRLLVVGVCIVVFVFYVFGLAHVAGRDPLEPLRRVSGTAIWVSLVFVLTLACAFLGSATRRRPGSQP